MAEPIDFDVSLTEFLVCPACRGPLGSFPQRFECAHCATEYPIHKGVPILLTSELREAGRMPVRDTHKARQASSHDQHETPEFEIERPRRTPAFYGCLMLDKFRRSVLGLEHMLAGATAVTLCGGSGMDAELLARAGARVIATDISHGAASRTRERAARSGLPILSVVADAECLPLSDRTIDLAYVHDGLHHLEVPERGLDEMARVARGVISISEPASAAVTAVAVKAGLALAYEDSGNTVARLGLTYLVEYLRSKGFYEVNPHRYGMYYQHHPGRVVSFLSRSRLRAPAFDLLCRANRFGGSLGNKLTVQAQR